MARTRVTPGARFDRFVASMVRQKHAHALTSLRAGVVELSLPVQYEATNIYYRAIQQGFDACVVGRVVKLVRPDED